MDPFDIIGTVVDGRYRIERVAGQGGFGVVYRAFHLGFEAPIALKVLKVPHSWSSVRREARVVAFQREGRMLFELSRLHPAIVRAFETGTLRTDEAPTPYLSLEWLDGVSLDREMRCRRQRALPPLDLDQVLALLEDPAAGLARAHAQGIAHRDIKPGNLFVSCNGEERRCKILDFGIAKLVSDETESPLGNPALTGTTSFTPQYASPEQWSKRIGPTGPWTDVHAFALVCSELLSGRSPFTGQDSAELQARCLDATSRPTPERLGVSLPPAVEAVFSRALAIDPRERYRDVGAFWRALRAASNVTPSTVSFNSFAWNDECERGAALAERDLRRDSISAATDSRATSMTCSREASASKQLLPKSARFQAVPSVLGLGLLSAGLLASFGVGRVGRHDFSTSQSKPSFAPPSTPRGRRIPDATATVPSSQSAALPADAAARREPATRTLPSARSLPATNDRRGPNGVTRNGTRPSVATARAPGELDATRLASPDIDLDDPGFVRRR